MLHLRTPRIIPLGALVALGFSVFVLLAGLFVLLAATTEEKERERVTSPDGTVDAVVFAVRGGGRLAYEYLYLTPAGEPAQKGELALTPKGYPKGGFRLRWRDEGTLGADPRSVTDAVLRATYYPEEVRSKGYQVEWWAEPGSELPWDAEPTP